MFKIRKISKKDLEKILALEKELFKKNSWSYPLLEKEFENPFSQIWILEKEQPLGYLIFRQISEEAEILRLGIKTEYQHQNWGTLFLNFF